MLIPPIMTMWISVVKKSTTASSPITTPVSTPQTLVYSGDIDSHE